MLTILRERRDINQVGRRWKDDARGAQIHRAALVKVLASSQWPELFDDICTYYAR